MKLVFTTRSTYGLAFLIAGASVYYSAQAEILAITPDDDDADTTVTAFLDVDGAYIRPARTTLLHAMDSVRNADLHGPDRMDMDRYSSRSERAGRLPTSGLTLRLLLFTGRAGDALAPRDLILDVTTHEMESREVTADTTTRTDVDGAKMTVSATRVFHAANSARNTDLASVSTDQDRFWTKHDIPSDSARALIHRVMLVSDGRAGDCWAPKELTLNVTPSGTAEVAAKAT